MLGIPFRLQAPGSEPYLVDDKGQLKPSHLAVWSRAGKPKTNPLCDMPLSGTETLTLPLRPTQSELIEAEWSVKLGYFSKFESRVQVELLDDTGRTVELPEPADAWPAGAASMYFGPSPRILATSIRIRPADPKTFVCITDIEIGLPVVTG